jgi:hypothetical protein
VNASEPVLEAAAESFQRVLWESDAASAARDHLARRGLTEETLRSFGVGYAPSDPRQAAGELEGAAEFRSRVIFPVRDAGGGLAGFAGMATNPGPSWPRWVTSPEDERYSRASGLFGIDRARDAIESSGRVFVVADCIDVMLAHQGGDQAVVAVTRSPVARGHLERLGALMGAGLEDLWVDHRHEQAGVAGTLVVRTDARTAAEEASLTRADVEREKTNPALRTSADSITPDVKQELTARGHAGLWLTRAVLGVGVPLAWMAILRPSSGDPDGGQSTFVIGVGGVALTYAVLTVLASFVSARIRERSRARRMRTPWERGATEWQPPAWTYHLFEEVLVGAALISILVCIALFVTIGGFTN